MMDAKVSHCEVLSPFVNSSHVNEFGAIRARQWCLLLQWWHFHLSLQILLSGGSTVRAWLNTMQRPPQYHLKIVYPLFVRERPDLRISYDSGPAPKCNRFVLSAFMGLSSVQRAL